MISPSGPSRRSKRPLSDCVDNELHTSWFLIWLNYITTSLTHWSSVPNCVVDFFRIHVFSLCHVPTFMDAHGGL